ncbi:MAG: tRNA 5-methoxyuridine(34)/uridine 5-oxyacetic acid(34) synthase CmoB [Desulfosarcinaceae bacterium]
MVQLHLLDRNEVNHLFREIARFEDSLGELGRITDLKPAFEAALDGVRARWKKDAKARAYDATLDTLPLVTPAHVILDQDRVRIGDQGALSANATERLLTAAQALIPWRKGPFDLFGQALDCEWASNLKWDRLKDHIQPLTGRRILDIGSSNGYYLWRMAAAGPRLALGIEPYLTFFAQYLLLQHFIRHPRVFCLPLKLDQLPEMATSFDTLFCMGILYHSRDPLGMLAHTRRLLCRGGELILETLVIEPPEDHCLCPQERYAKMANVWFIPNHPGGAAPHALDAVRIPQRLSRSGRPRQDRGGPSSAAAGGPAGNGHLIHAPSRRSQGRPSAHPSGGPFRSGCRPADMNFRHIRDVAPVAMNAYIL